MRSFADPPVIWHPECWSHVSVNLVDMAGLICYNGNMRRETPETAWKGRKMRSQAIFILLTAVILILGMTSASLTAPRIIYVDDSATGTNTGSSWANAYRYLQDALADANAADKPVEVRIAQGTYSPDLGKQVVRGDYLTSFRITDGMVIKGGFAGVTGPDPNLRDPHVYRTILTGDLARDDVPMADASSSYDDPSKNDNSSCIVLVEQAGPDTLLEGVIITGTFPGVPGLRSAPLHAYGLYAGRDTSLTIRDCTFIENLTSGMGCLASNLTVVDCLFENNFRPTGGGGMRVSGGNLRIVGCTFKQNQGVGGGGIRSGQSTLWLEDCKFKDNTAFEMLDGSFGGGLYCLSARDESTLLRCEFEGNTAAEGGGAYLEASFIVKDCTFRRNHVLQWGGALSQFSKVDIQGCVFSGNSAREGGAIFNRAGQGDLAQCLFSGNVARSGGACIYATGPRVVGHRGAWRHLYFHLTLTNCTTADNIAPLGRTIQCISDPGGSPDTNTLRIIELHT